MIAEAHPESRKFLAIINACGGGDWPPVLALAVGLRERGHQVRVACDPETESAVQTGGLETLCLPESLSLGRYYDPAIESYLSGAQELTSMSLNPLIDWGKACLPHLFSLISPWRPEFILSSLFGQGLAQAISEIFQVPRCFLNPAFYFGEGARRSWESDFSPVGSRMYRYWLWPLVRKASLVLHATDPVFDPAPVLMPSHHRYTGPLFHEAPGDFLEFSQVPGFPWILISLSTSPQQEDLKIVEIALAALKGMDFRVVATLPGRRDRPVTGETGEQVRFCGYVPHSRLLPFCRMLICHAGHGTVMKALYYGIPMVLIPWGRDQSGVAFRAKALGTAIVIRPDEYTPETLRRAIIDLSENPEYRERAAYHGRRLRAGNPLMAALGAVESWMRK